MFLFQKNAKNKHFKRSKFWQLLALFVYILLLESTSDFKVSIYLPWYSQFSDESLGSTKIQCIYFSELIIAKLYWYTKTWAYVLLSQSQVKKSKAFVVEGFLTCFTLDTKICIKKHLEERNFEWRGSHLNTEFQLNVKRTKIIIFTFQI